MGGGSSKNKQKKASEEVRVQKQYEHVPTEMSKASPYPTSNKKFDEISNLGEEEIYRPQIIKQLPRPVSERHDGKTLEAMISKLIIQNSEKLDENFILDIWGKHLSDKDFIRETKNLKFPKIKQVRLRWLGEFKSDKEMKDVNEFMENSIRSNLPYLGLHGGSKHVDISLFKTGLDHLLSKVISEIYIDTVFINEDMLKLIFEKGYRVSKIILGNGKVSIGDEFSISSILSYKLNHLDLYGTCAEENEDYISDMQSFAEALSNTNILHTLKYLHVRDSWFPKENVEQIFSRLGFDIKVDGSHSFPDEMQDEQQE